MSDIDDKAVGLKIRDYSPEPTAREFHADNSPVRGIMGPVGSGKSVACCMEVWTRIIEQKVSTDGVTRLSRWAFIRNTQPELLSTTMKTWQEWVPDELCHINMRSPMTGKMDFWLEDGTRVKAEVIFLAIDRPEDARKLKSLELTGAFLNEAAELDKEVYIRSIQRTGRYPPKQLGGSNFYGVIMDTNPPSDVHWWYKMAEELKPEGTRFWRQPPAVLPIRTEQEGMPVVWVPNRGQTEGIPKAENIQWHDLGFDYYIRQTHGADDEWIRVFLMGEYGTLITGRSVYPEYNDATHFSKNPIEPMRGMPVILGFDFGLTPACVFCQQTTNGALIVLDECVSTDMELRQFAEEVIRPKLNTVFAGMSVVSVGDPSGDFRTPDGNTCFRILSECGINCVPASSNDPLIRRDAVKYFLNKMAGGKPAFRISPNAPTLRRGFQGSYFFKKLRSGAGDHSDRFNEVADKNFYSHIHDAMQYVALYVKGVNTKQSAMSWRPISRSKPMNRNGWT